MRRSARALLALAASVALVLALEARAGASAGFPGVVQQALGASAPPQCTVCHTTPAGGLGTATQPLAVYLKSRGLVPGDDASLRGALQAMVGEGHDSNGDGKTDADALRAGEDPNGAVDASVPPVAYGCGARVAAGRSADASAALLALAAVAALTAPRRRARRA